VKSLLIQKSHARECFRNFLRGKNLLLTTERSRLLDIIFSQRRHFCIYDLHQMCQVNQQKVSLATIYRTLPLMEKAGLIRAVNLKADNWLYENTYFKHHHDHMVCVACGKIIEFENVGIEKMQSKVCKKHDFIMTEHTLELRGYCSHCKKTRKISALLGSKTA